MADDKSPHKERLETGASVVLVLALSMVLLQVLYHVGMGVPDVGGWLPWTMTAIIAVVLWMAIYVIGWIVQDGAPLLAHRYERWAKGESPEGRFDA